MNRACVIIPAHNRRAFTLSCLRALQANGDLAAFEVIVVDDGSTDGTADAIRHEFPEVVVLAGTGELFWTGAISLAMQEVAKRSTAPLFWLNDDCRPRPGALPTLREFLEQNPDAIAGPRCVDIATGNTVPTGFIWRRIYSAQAGETRAVHGLAGFCVGLGVQAWTRLGTPDPTRFPHYCGDTAYTLTAHRAGCAVVLVGDAIVDLVDYRGGFASLRDRVALGVSRGAVWREVFASPGSPYRLRTLFALQALKYGAGVGTLIAVLRAIRWMAAVGWIRVRAARKRAS